MQGLFVTFVLAVVAYVFFYEALRGSSKGDRSLTSK